MEKEKSPEGATARISRDAPFSRARGERMHNHVLSDKTHEAAMNNSILILDGDAPFARDLSAHLGRNELHAAFCPSLSKGLAMLHVGDFSLVLLGDNMPDGNALEFLSTLREVPSRPEVIVMSAGRNPDLAEEAIRGGAWNFLPKPVNTQRLVVLARRALDYHRERPAKAAPISLRREGIIGNSRLIQSCLDIVAQAAAADVSVLVTGETGTGKELFARAIHANSGRAAKPFVVVDCAALPDTLAESMLFGHERGAFTSADSRSVGLVAQADGGTLFLDEVGELPLGVQKVFLRVLEGQSFRPVGASREVTSNFRLVAATNRDLSAMVENGTFRQDLYFRLRGLRLELPALRGILDDLNDLVCAFVRRHCVQRNVNTKGFSPDFLDTLLRYDWPGNVRELLHTVDQAVVVAGDEPILYPLHLPRTIRASVARKLINERPGNENPTPTDIPNQDDIPDQNSFPTLHAYREEHLAALEKRYFTDLMRVCEGQIHCACRLSGLSRPRLYALLKERGIQRH